MNENTFQIILHNLGDHFFLPLQDPNTHATDGLSLAAIVKVAKSCTVYCVRPRIPGLIKKEVEVRFFKHY